MQSIKLLKSLSDCLTDFPSLETHTQINTQKMR